MTERANDPTGSADAGSPTSSSSLTSPSSVLDASLPFARRHIGPAPEDQAKMLAVLGYPSLEDLVDAAVPASVHSDTPLALDRGRAEHEVLDELRALAAKNQVLVSMIGLGYHGTVTPPVILRNVLESPAWYTAYTPYQPEISQGRLEALLNFQTVVTDLTGLPVAGASLLDEAHRRRRGHDARPPHQQGARRRRLRRRLRRAAADARGDRHPGRAARPRGRGRRRRDRRAARAGDVFGVLLQYPGATGAVRDLGPVVAAAKERGALVAVAADLLALTLLRSPAELGADVAVGSTQRFGVPMGFGGPHAAYMSVRQGLERQMPGRLVGVSKDADRAPGVPAGAADPRAAHPSREGDQQHLHGAGPARRGRRHVRRLPRPGGPARDRPPGARLRGRPRRWAAGGRRRGACTTRSSTPSWPVRRGARPRSSPPRWHAASTSGSSTPTGWASRPTRPRPGSTWPRCGAAFGIDDAATGDPAAAADRLRPPGSCPTRCAGTTTCSPTRSSTSTGPRPRCCGTCAGSPTRTSPSTGR